MKILIIQTAFIGDVVLTIPLLQVLKDKFHDSIIDFLCIPKTSGLFIEDSRINELFIYDKRSTGLRGMKEIINTLREKGYDLVICPHRSIRSALISFLIKPKSSVGFNLKFTKYFFKRTVLYENNTHEILRNLKLLEVIDVFTGKIVKPELHIPEFVVNKINLLLAEKKIFGEKFLTIAPGSIWFTKRYPKEKYLKVILELKKSNIDIALVGSGEDLQICNYLIENSDYNKLYNFAGALSLIESAELIKRSEKILTNDSALLHIADAVSTKVIAIFGPTVPEFGFYPINYADKIIQIEGLSCRPCAIHGGNKCPVKTFDCMQKIDVKSIINEIL
jgi:heptosyltransferase II